MLIVRVSGSGKTNALLNPIEHAPNSDKVFCMQKIPVKQNINY